MAVVSTAALEDAIRTRAIDAGRRLGEAFATRAQSHAPRRTGELAGSIKVRGVAASGNHVRTTVVAAAEHARYQDEGTGIYGPRGGRIQGHPLLAFDWPAAGGTVIVHSVAGSPATRFWKRTRDAWGQIVRSVNF